MSRVRTLGDLAEGGWVVSMSPPRNPTVGDMWVDPYTAERYIFTGSGEPYIAPSGAHLDALDGWVKWDQDKADAEVELMRKAAGS